MSNNACDAIRHKTKKFSFKRKPFDVNQTGQVTEVQEHHILPEVSQPKQTIKHSPEPRKPTTETKKPTPETRKTTQEIKKQIPETENYTECVNMCKSQNVQTEIITHNDNVEMVIKTMMKLKKIKLSIRSSVLIASRI